jgi:hypothetical protein
MGDIVRCMQCVSKIRLAAAYFAFLIAPFLAGCEMESTVRSDKPLTSAEAGNLNLPASASEIYYLIYGGGLQDLEYFVRYRVPPSEADQIIETLIAGNNKVMTRTLPFLRTSLPSPRPAEPYVDSIGRFKPISWWQPQTIRNGYFRGETAGHAPRIWYDSDNSIIYIYIND